ncbi:MAG: T9SS type A sorting domain-containing protein [Chitinophagales bacterium]|nr:T9SS type A sorting domain-containing protein [Chitinophagales bacterium]
MSYQWAAYNYGSNSYTNIGGATNAAYTTDPLTNADHNDSALYKYKVTYNRAGSGCSAASDDIEITIFPTPSLTSTMEDCASTVVDNGNDKWDYIYTNGSASTPGFMVSDSSGGAELVYPANNGVQNFKIYRVPMGSGSHDFKIVDDNGCIAVSTLNKNSALPTTVPTTLPSTNNGQCYVKGFNEWVHIRKQGSSNEAMVSVQDNGVDLGLVTATSYLESTTPSVNNMGVTCNGTPQAAMRRHFVVKSSNYPDPSTKFQDNNANPTNVNLRLYFTQADFADLSSASTANNVIGNQCTEDDDITDKQDLYLTKYSDYGQLGNEDGDYMNNTFTSAYFKVFNVGNLTNPLTIQDNGFDTEFGTNSSNIHYAELSVSEFSEFWLHGSTSGAPLPVEMLYIEAKNINNEYIKINWATATELNNRMFEVERSTDGTSFSKIGTVMGNGTSTERHDYSYNDKTAAVGIRYYYRLKQIDFDEAYEYSPVVSEMLKGDEMFKVSEFVPNPAADNAKIFITTGKEQGIQIEMHNYIGEVVKHGAMYLNKGNNTVSFDFADLAAGTYTTRIVAGTNTYIRRVVITR